MIFFETGREDLGLDDSCRQVSSRCHARHTVSFSIKSFFHPYLVISHVPFYQIMMHETSY